MPEQQLGPQTEIEFNGYIASLKNNNLPLLDLLNNIRETYRTHLENGSIKTSSILESRFTPAEEAWKKKINSCGALTNIATDILTKLGYEEIELIHGSIPTSSNHAWFSVKNPETNEQKQYDLTQDGDLDKSVGPNHEDKIICKNWEEIREQLVRIKTKQQKEKQ